MNVLSHDALNEICSFKITETMFSSGDVISLFSKFDNRYNSIRCFNFDPPFKVSDFDCYNLAGILKLRFEQLIDFLRLENQMFFQSFTSKCCRDVLNKTEIKC